MAERGENFTDDEKRAIAMAADILLSVGATWDQVRLELFRISCSDSPPFNRVPCQAHVENIVLEVLGMANFTEYREKRKDGVKVALKNKAVQMAMAGNTAMLIFCLKNLCGWSDNVQAVPDPEDAKNKIRMAYDINNIPAIAK